MTRSGQQVFAHELGPAFAQRAAAHDADDSFVGDNYLELKRHRLFSAGVPAELGGGGLHIPNCVCCCASWRITVAQRPWRWRQGHAVEPLLKRIAKEETVLISTGASDWLESSGKAEKVDDGYRVTARKIFASGCPMGDLLMTSAPYDDPDNGPTVLHFPVPFAADGVKVTDNWHTLGMRGTGSHDATLDGVFVTESTISLRRPKGKWHPFFNVVTAVAPPLIMAVYVGVAEAAVRLACRKAVKKPYDPHIPYPAG